jgi:hypothetical protein
MKFKSEYYNETQIDSIIFSFGFKDDKINRKDNLSININFQNYKNYNLPISMNQVDYGRLIMKNKIETGINYLIHNKNGETIILKKFEKSNEVEFFKSGISLVKFKDTLIKENKFMREIDNKYFYFENGVQILFSKILKTKFIKKIKKTKNLVNNFITLDIETFVDNHSLVPFLISFYDGEKSYSF